MNKWARNVQSVEKKGCRCEDELCLNAGNTHIERDVTNSGLFGACLRGCSPPVQSQYIQTR